MKVRVTAGAGASLKFTTAMAANVPNDPIISFAMSRPATFFTTMPPELDQLSFQRRELHADDDVARGPVQTPARAARVRSDHSADCCRAGERRIKRESSDDCPQAMLSDRSIAYRLPR